MFPLAHLVLTSERESKRELEIQRQACEMHWHVSDANPSQKIEPQRKRNSIFVWILRKRATNPQPAYECSQECCP
jgi:hypothetical protein